MADIITTFDGDGRPLENVIGRLSKEFVDFAKTAQSSFDTAQSALNKLSSAGKDYGKVLDQNSKKVKKLENASSFPAVGSSSLGINDAEIRKIQAAMSDSTRGARELTNQLEEASRVRFNDDQIAAIQSGLSDSRRQASELAEEIRKSASGGGGNVEFLREQVNQYNQILERERELKKTLDERLSKSKEIEKAAKTDTSSQIGLTEDQIRKVQAALAESPRLAKELTEEFLKQNAALNTGTDLVKRTGSEIVKAYGTDLVKRTGSEIVKYTGDAAKKTAQFAKETGAAEKASGALKSIWSALAGIPDLPSLRYALYDIKNTAEQVARAAAAFAITPIGFSIKYEREFANVIRTNELGAQSIQSLADSALDSVQTFSLTGSLIATAFGDLAPAAEGSIEQVRDTLRSELQQIAQLTPISWEEVTNIAALAGQLGIGIDLVAEFTDVTAKFAATTDLSVQAAATAFGRLNQLIVGVDGNFEGLGSAILAVGVDSVATESQIVNVSTQIASMGNLAGLSAAEIVGLSGAIASLGIQPELARGTITRLFSNIGKSAVSGGYNVEEFGRLTNRTAEQFVADWSTQPGRVLQDFFDGINREGPEAERTLRSLGITSVRDIPAILRLAQNSQEVSRLIALSAEEYANAGKVNEQYGIISGTTAEQLKRLGQNFQLLGAAVGDSIGPLAGLFQLLNNIVQGMTIIAQSPIGQFFSGIAIVVALLVAALGTLVASFAGTIASMIALRFAARQMGVDVGTLIKTMFGLKVANDAVATSSAGAAKGLAAVRAVMKTMLVFTVLSLLFAGISAAIGSMGNEAENSQDAVTQLYGTMDGLREAIDRDTEAFDEMTGKMKDGSDAILVYKRSLEEATEETVNSYAAGMDYVQGQNQIEGSTREATAAIEDQTRAIAENTLAYTQQKLLEQGNIVKALGDEDLQQIFEETGIDINEMLAAGIRGEADPMIDALVENTKKARTAVQDEMTQLVSISTQRALTAEEQARLDELLVSYDKYAEQIKVLDVELRTFLGTTQDAINLDASRASTIDFLSRSVENAGRKFALAREELERINGILFTQANYSASVTSAIDAYALALQETGAYANSAAAELGGVLNAILAAPGGDVDTILADLGTFLKMLEEQGPETASAQELVRDAIKQVGIEAGLTEEQVYALTNATGTFALAPLGSLEAMKESIRGIGQAFAESAPSAVVASEQMEQAIQSIIIAAGNDVNAAINGMDGFYEAVVNGGLLTESQLISLQQRIIETYRVAAEARIALLKEERAAMGTIIAGGMKGRSGSGREIIAITNQIRQTENSVTRLTSLLKQVGSNTEEASKYSALLRQGYQGARQEAGGTAREAKEVKKQTREAAEEVRTLLDYAGDLSKVFSRAFDLRFMSILSLDKITSAWRDFGETIQNARDSIDELVTQQRELIADRSIKQYFLSVAEAYGDTLRADKIRAELAKIDEDIAKGNEEIAKKTDEASTSTVGNTFASIRNREALTSLVKNYQDYIESLAASGASQGELQSATEASRAAFIEQATALGFAEEEIKEYAAAFDDVTFAINNVPRNVTIEADVNPALTALRELEAQQNRNIELANELNTAMNMPSGGGGGGGGGGRGGGGGGGGFPKQGQIDSARASLAGLRQQLDRVNRNIRATEPAVRAGAAPRSVLDSLYRQRGQIATNIRLTEQGIARLEAEKKAAGYMRGGFTGQGSKYEPAGIVHKGEYVIPKDMVDQATGMPKPEFLAQMKNMQGYMMGGFVGAQTNFPDTMMVELSPYDRKLLAEAGNVQLNLNGRMLAAATNSSNVVNAQRGSN